VIAYLLSYVQGLAPWPVNQTVSTELEHLLIMPLSFAFNSAELKQLPRTLDLD